MQKVIIQLKIPVMIRTIKLFLVLLTFPVLVSAQGYEDQQWISAGIKYKIDKEWSVDAEQGWRISELAWTSVMYTDIGINYKLNKYLKFSAGYRLSFRNGSWFNYRNVDHRFYFDVTPSIKLGEFKLSTRIRIQSGRRDWATSADGAAAERTLRNKLTIEYDAGDFTPYVNGELYTPLQKSGYFSGPNQLRLQAGCEYKVNKKLDLGLFLLRQKEFNSRNPETNGIIGINVSIGI